MNAAETESIRNNWSAARVDIPDDVGCIEESDLLEPANGASVPIGTNDQTSETPLVQPDARLSNGVSTLNGILDQFRLTIVKWSDHATDRNEDCAIFRPIFDD
ncbi:MAG TPA: hypothetical protein VH306_02255 [Gaiellaceae bacterium]|jgi:hypothetical protein